MRHFLEPFRGIAIAFIIIVTVVGGLTLALSQGGQAATPGPAAHVTKAPTETLFVPSPIIPTSNHPSSTQPPTSLSTLAYLSGQAEPHTPCPPPEGWIPTTVTTHDTLISLAARAGISVQAILQANCLTAEVIFVGAILFVPPSPPTSPPDSITCGPPRDWVYYTVQPGDNLFRLSLRYGVSSYALRQANCLPGVSITVGQRLFVPPIALITDTPLIPTAPNTLTPTPLPVATQSVVPTNTTAPATPTETFTSTATDSLTPTATSSSTDTATPTLSDTATATETPTPTAISP